MSESGEVAVKSFSHIRSASVSGALVTLAEPVQVALDSRRHDNVVNVGIGHYATIVGNIHSTSRNPCSSESPPGNKYQLR